MRTLIVSTIRHNPGDGFIRLGLQWLLSRTWPDFAPEVVHKHDPRTLFGDRDRGPRTPHRLVAPLLYRWHARTSPGEDLLATCDLVAFAGTPFIWRQQTRLLPSTSANAEWVDATWGRLFSELPDVPVLHLAAGTSLNLGQGPEDVLEDPEVATFLRRAVERAALTTARDPLTAQILAAVGHEVPVLPCTSLWAARGAGVDAAEPRHVAVNVMPHMVHTARGKETGSAGWRSVITEVVSELARRHSVHLVCHSSDELDVARSWFPEHPATFSLDEAELLEVYAGARYTVSNRVHGAAAGASFMRPALCIGGDSRRALIGEFGLPTLGPSEASASAILEACDAMEADADGYTRRLLAVADEAEASYMQLIADAIPA